MRLLVIAVLAVGAALLLSHATTLGAQTTDDYPDLVTDPPEDLELAEEIDWNGLKLVVRFDGFVTNVGGGPVHIAGNPQASAALGTEVAQHILNSAGSSLLRLPYDVTSADPAIQYENSDGHNHWHLMRIMEYSLWDSTKTVQVTPGDKIGFCLWDIEQISGSAPGVYNGGGNWCAGDGWPGGGPGATYLEMGITEGWRDTYGSHITLQWVDVSDVAPGNYYLSALSDPNDVIAESDETNNYRVWTDEVTVIEGYLANDVGTVAATGATQVTLSSTTYSDGSAGNGAPGTRMFRIESGPSHGTLSVATGVGFTGPTITYTPDAGYDGPDSFTYRAYDADSSYPANPDPAAVDATVTLSVTAPNNAPTLTDPANRANDVGDSINFQLSATDADDDPLTFSATGIPPGITFNPATGRFGGSPTTPGSFTVTVTVDDGEDDDSAVFGWEIGGAANQPPTVTNPGDQATPVDEAVSLQIVASDPEDDSLGFAATGLPPGLSIGQSTGLIIGTPTSIGSSDVTVTVTDGLLDTDVAFTWVITEVLSGGTSVFDDVPEGHIFGDAIAWMASSGITAGCDADNYCPDEPVTRAQVASFFSRAFGLTAGAGADLFTDDDGSTHEDNIDRLATAGITNGCTATTFCPNDLVTRAQFASLLVRATGLTAGAGSDLFTDDDGSTHEDNIDRLATAGITNGCTTTTFCPGDTVTRGQLAALLYRAETNGLLD